MNRFKTIYSGIYIFAQKTFQTLLFRSVSLPIPNPSGPFSEQTLFFGPDRVYRKPDVIIASPNDYQPVIMSDIYRTYIKPGRTRLIMTASHVENVWFWSKSKSVWVNLVRWFTFSCFEIHFIAFCFQSHKRSGPPSSEKKTRVLECTCMYIDEKSSADNCTRSLCTNDCNFIDCAMSIS